jgi:5'(3')-deoxyribonucleotidase
MVSEKTIALDLDSVLADVMLIWIEEYNMIFHANIEKKEILDWHLHNVLPISKNQISDLFISVWKNRWRDIPPTSSDVAKVIDDLMKQGFRISIITKRERVTMPFVSYWLDFHNISFNDIIFIFDDAPKNHFPFFLLVDDSPINAKEITPPKRIVIFDQPWNRSLDSFPRIVNLNQLPSLL